MISGVTVMNGTQTLNRALDIVFALAASKGTLSVPEIAQEVGIPESTTYRFLQTLEQNGIVERKGKGHIRLGMRILDLARSLNQQTDKKLLILTKPLMEEIRNKTNETCLLFIRSYMNVICIQSTKSQALIHFSIDNGRILPLHFGASGKVILAFENETLKKRVINEVATEFNNQCLFEELEQIRAQGYSITKGEIDEDVFAVSAPIFDVDGAIVASLSICAPSYRCNDDNIPSMVNEIVKAAKEVSERLKG